MFNKGLRHTVQYGHRYLKLDVLSICGNHKSCVSFLLYRMIWFTRLVSEGIQKAVPPILQHIRWCLERAIHPCQAQISSIPFFLLHVYTMALKKQCQDIFDIFFCLKDSTWVPNERRKRFHEFFRLCKDIREQNSKITCPRSQRLRRHVNVSLDTDVFIFFNYCYRVCKHTQVPFFTWLFL